MRNPFEVYTSLRSERSPRPLDWEESAVDAQTQVEGFYNEERSSPAFSWMAVLVLLVFVGLAVRLFHLQIIQGSSYRELSEDNRIRRQTLLAPRGVIKDRFGRVLAENTASFNLVAIPFDLPKENLSEHIAKLSELFGLDQSEIGEKLKNINRASFEPVLIAQDISPQQSILFETKASQLYGFQILKIPVRQYPEAKTFSHVLGYTGIVSPSDLEQAESKNYDVNDFIGKLGIEYQYEKYLHGRNGENLVEVDATGRLQNVLGENSPDPGNFLELNIDKELQEMLYRDLTEGFSGRKAAAIAMNPKNGEVLALVSVPGFDNNLFAHGIKKNQYQQLLDDKTLPLFNRAIQGVYPPGSTVKPMVAIAALEEGIVNENTVIYDNGALVIPNQYNPSIAYQFRGWKLSGLGPMNIRSAIAESSDIYFYVVSGGHPSTQIKGLGAEKLAAYYRKFNLGNTTGIDLQGEKSGVVADPDWKAEYFKSNAVLSKWYLGDTYHIGIGQGDMLVTPLQVALWTATIANGGSGYKPKIARRAIDNKGNIVWENEPELLISNFASPRNIKISQEGMRQTVLAGSGRQLATLKITAAGKTGTSQFDGSDPTRTHAWFTAYAPFEDPQIVITVLVESGGEGHSAAVPVVRQALEWWQNNRYNK